MIQEPVNSFPIYFAIISLTMTALLLWLNRRLDQGLLRVDRSPKFNRKVAFDLALVIMITGFFGGRLLHVVFEEWLYYLTYPQEIFKFWKGGFVYYGGFITSLLASYLYLKYRKLSLWPWADFFTPLLSLGYAFGRVACYLEGCCYGNTFIPLQLIMVFAELSLFGLIVVCESRKWFTNPGQLFAVWMIGHGLTRFLLEFYRTDFRGEMLFGALSISQVISIAIVIFGLLIIRKSSIERTTTIKN